MLALGSLFCQGLAVSMWLFCRVPLYELLDCMGHLFLALGNTWDLPSCHTLADASPSLLLWKSPEWVCEQASLSASFLQVGQPCS